MALPILFFPGVMGSRLYFPNSRRYWDPDSYLRMARWAPIRFFRTDDDNRRTLHFEEPAGVIAEAVSGHPEGEALGWGGLVWSFYFRYMAALRVLAADGKAFAVGYDWRQDYRTLGEFAADKINKALDETGADKIWIAAHSMGGIVVRAALRTQPELAERIAKVIFVCQPATGAVILYRRLFTGLVRDLDGGGGVADRVFRLLLGNTREAFIGNMSGQPGPLQLVPSGFFPAGDGGVRWHQGLTDGMAQLGLYLNDDSPPGLFAANVHPDPSVRADFRNRVEETLECHEWLGPPVMPPEIETWQIAGNNRMTEVGIQFEAARPVPGRRPEGDETVPRLSGTAMQVPPDKTILVNDMVHADACNKLEVETLTRSIFV